METKIMDYTPINKLKNIALKRNLKPSTCKSNKEFFSYLNLDPLGSKRFNSMFNNILIDKDKF